MNQWVVATDRALRAGSFRGQFPAPKSGGRELDGETYDAIPGVELAAVV